MKVHSKKQGLQAEIDACGYFPELVEDTMTLALGDEELIDFVVHHEPTFNHDEIHRHVTILALTPSRLIVGHTDDHPTDPSVAGPTTGISAAASTESVGLTKINSVVVTRVVTQPEGYTSGSDVVTETWLTVGWGAVRRIDVEQASCNDAQCEADHGFTGALVGDDLTVRMSSAADGPDRVTRLVQFASRLQRAAAV